VHYKIPHIGYNSWRYMGSQSMAHCVQSNVLVLLRQQRTDWHEGITIVSQTMKTNNWIATQITPSLSWKKTRQQLLSFKFCLRLYSEQYRQYGHKVLERGFLLHLGRQHNYSCKQSTRKLDNCVFPKN
jgi:hypothetical protein